MANANRAIHLSRILILCSKILICIGAAMARALEIILTEAERGGLERRARRHKIARGDAMRVQNVLLAASGYGNSAISRSVNGSAGAPFRLTQKPGKNF
jgi:hypothetical protein